MQIFLIIVGVIILLRFIGKAVWNNEDKHILNNTPNHPSKISESKYPVGSGSCNKRNGDRHIWDYYMIEQGEPTMRGCRYCFKTEKRDVWSNNWNSSV